MHPTLNHSAILPLVHLEKGTVTSNCAVGEGQGHMCGNLRECPCSLLKQLLYCIRTLLVHNAAGSCSQAVAPAPPGEFPAHHLCHYSLSVVSGRCWCTAVVELKHKQDNQHRLVSLCLIISVSAALSGVSGRCWYTMLLELVHKQGNQHRLVSFWLSVSVCTACLLYQDTVGAQLYWKLFPSSSTSTAW